MSAVIQLYSISGDGTEIDFDDGDGGGLRVCEDCGGTSFGVIDDTGEVICKTEWCECILGAIE